MALRLHRERRRGVCRRNGVAVPWVLGLALLICAPGAQAHWGHEHPEARTSNPFLNIGSLTQSADGGFVAASNPTSFIDVTWPELKPPCRRESDQFASRVIPVYTHRPGEGRAVAPDRIRRVIEEMNWKLNDEAKRSSGGQRPLQLVVECDRDGEIAVHDVPTEAQELWEINQDVHLTLDSESNEPGVGKGYGRANRWLTFDDTLTIVPHGHGCNDPEKIAENCNNRKEYQWAYVSRNFWDPELALHEVFHALGAVNWQAPNASLYGHCYDGMDIMCYEDDRSFEPETKKYSEDVCPREQVRSEGRLGMPLDCNNDDYFDPIAEPGEWLASNFNLAEDSAFIEIPPEATTNAPSEVMDYEATLTGTVNPMGEEARYHFEYRVVEQHCCPLIAGEWISLPQKSAGSGTTPVAVHEVVRGLQPYTSYQVRLVAKTTKDAADHGVAHNLRTQAATEAPQAPTVETQDAAAVSGASATLKASVHPQRLQTSYHFKYGPTSSYGSQTAVQTLPAGSTPTIVSAHVPGLSSDTDYHFRVVATNAEGTVAGGDKVVRTCSSAGCQPTLQPTPNPAPRKESAFDDVSCVSSSFCFAVGTESYTGRGFLQTTNGSEWKVVSRDLPATRHAVHCFTATSCLAVGTTAKGTALAEHINLLSEWWVRQIKTVPTPTDGTNVVLKDISCSSSSACTAVGHYHKEGVQMPLVARWNGGAWSLQSPVVPGPGAELLGVSCPTESSCTAVGRSNGAPFAERWSGGAWTISTPVAPEGSASGVLRRVSCPTAANCVAVGYYASGPMVGKALVERFAGGQWSIVQVPQPNHEKGKIELNDVACPAIGACIAVGRYPTGSPWVDRFEPLVQVWDGSQWTVKAFPPIAGMVGTTLSGVSCTATWPLCTVVGSARSSTISETVTVGGRFQ